MKTINISVRDKLPLVTSMSGRAVADNRYRLQFNFDDEWVEGLKTVVVAVSAKQYRMYPTTADYVDIELSGERYITVGVLQDTVATSRPCQILVNESIRQHMGDEIKPPEPDVWTYITDQIRTLNSLRLYPVEKTEAMTQQVGVDAERRLWTYPGGSGGSGGIDRIFIMEGASSYGPPTYTLNVQLTNGSVITCQLPNMGLELSDVITVSPSSPITSWASGYVGELWFDTTDRILYVCISSNNAIGAQNWLAVGGGSSSGGGTGGRGVLDVVFEAVSYEMNGTETYNMVVSLEDGTKITRRLPGFRNEDVVMFHNGAPSETLPAPRGKLLFDTDRRNMYVCADISGNGSDTKTIWKPISASGVHVGSDAPPAGTKVWVNPDGKRTKIPQVDETLTKAGYAADAAKVGERIDQLYGEIADNTPTLNYVETKTVYLGDNVIGAATLGAGWTESGGVFTHATGSDADLIFEVAVEDGAIYILEFDTSFTSNEFVRVGIGDRYRVLCYQGKSHITVPLMASGGTTLYITPISTTYVGSISNITLRKIQDSGTELVLEIYNTTTDNHTQNYGSWNTFIGENTAENAVGSTRSVVIGYYTLNALQGGHRNIGIGTFAMSQMIGGEDNVAIGSDNMLEVKGAEACVSIGFAAMYKGKKRTEDIAIGISAMRGDATSDTGGNIAIGKQAGYKVTTAKSNIFLGKQAGYNLTSGYSNTLIGDGAAKSLTTGYFNTVIGRNAVVPAAARGTIVIGDGATATKNYQAVIGADNITETLVKGNLVVRGTDGVMRQIVFNADGTCSWTAVE